MKIRSLLLILLLFLLAPEALSAQRSERQDSDRDGPVERLLDRRDRLDLSDGQVARLEEIRMRMKERNRPLVGRLIEMRRQIRADFPERRRDMDRSRRKEFEQRVDAARPLLREIRENNREAMREVRDVLTGEQKDQLRRILKEDRKRRRRDDRDGRRDRGRGY